MSYLTVANMNKSYAATKIFENINFNVEQGEFVTLLGPSGCGKSTLLRCIAGLTSIDVGSVKLNNRDITNLTPQKRKIAMVFQSYALFPNMTVAQNIAFGLKMNKVAKNLIAEKVDKILHLVELENFSNRYPRQLSGGQCQRVALARALVIEPDLLLLDEPLGALDARIRKHLRDEIKAIQKKLNLTTIFVTHDQEEALQMSDRIVLMEQGGIVQNTDPATLYHSPVNNFAASFIGNYNILTASQINNLVVEQFEKKVAIRPETIQISTQQCNSSVKAIIINKQLLGNIIRYRTQVDNLTLNVDTLNLNQDLQLNSAVYLKIPLDKIHVLED